MGCLEDSIHKVAYSGASGKVPAFIRLSDFQTLRLSVHNMPTMITKVVQKRGVLLRVKGEEYGRREKGPSRACSLIGFERRDSRNALCSVFRNFSAIACLCYCSCSNGCVCLGAM